MTKGYKKSNFYLYSQNSCVTFQLHPTAIWIANDKGLKEVVSRNETLGLSRVLKTMHNEFHVSDVRKIPDLSLALEIVSHVDYDRVMNSITNNTSHKKELYMINPQETFGEDGQKWFACFIEQENPRRAIWDDLSDNVPRQLIFY